MRFGATILSCLQREVHTEARSFSDFAFYVNEPPVLMDDLVGNGRVLSRCLPGGW